MCREPLMEVQEKLYGLFDNVSSEKFLIELLKETKIQNSNLTGILNSLPEQFKFAFENGIAKEVVPYMENLLYGINTMNDQIKKLHIPKSNGDDGDVVDKLF